MIEPIPVYILAGGRSSRFGSDKARAELWGRPLLSHVVESVEPFAAAVTIVGAFADEYHDLGLRTIGDDEPDLGPVCGLVAALRDCAHDRLLLTSCDFVGLRAAWIETLLSEPAPTGPAICYRGDRWQPMLSVWRRSALASVEQSFDSGIDSMRGLLDAVGAHAIDQPTDWPAKPGINTPDDLDRFL